MSGRETPLYSNQWWFQKYKGQGGLIKFGLRRKRFNQKPGKSLWNVDISQRLYYTAVVELGWHRNYLPARWNDYPLTWKRSNPVKDLEFCWIIQIFSFNYLYYHIKRYSYVCQKFGLNKEDSYKYLEKNDMDQSTQMNLSYKTLHCDFSRVINRKTFLVHSKVADVYLCGLNKLLIMLRPIGITFSRLF